MTDILLFNPQSVITEANVKGGCLNFVQSKVVQSKGWLESDELCPHLFLLAMTCLIKGELRVD